MRGALYAAAVEPEGQFHGDHSFQYACPARNLPQWYYKIIIIIIMSQTELSALAAPEGLGEGVEGT